MNFSDISTYKRLQREEENNKLLQNLNTTVHHEMLAPLRANIDICQRLLRLVNEQEVKKLIQIILVSSQMVTLHANDLLDQRIIKEGCFVPLYTSGSLLDSINEMIELMNSTLTSRDLTILLKETG